MCVNKGVILMAKISFPNALKCTCQEPQNKNCPLEGPRISPIKRGNLLPIPTPTHSSAMSKMSLVGFKSVVAY